MESTAIIGYVILGLALTAAGFIPSFVAMYKKNSNASQLYKCNAIAVLGLGAVGLVLSLIFGVPESGKGVWLLVVLIVIEVLRLAAWAYLMYMAIKDNDLPIF